MIVEYDPESAILEESNTFDSELEGLYLDEPWADNNWIAEYDSEEQVNLQALQNRFDNIEGLDAWPGGGGVLPYKGLMGTCGQPG